MEASLEIPRKLEGASLSKERPLVTFPDGECAIYPYMPLSTRGYRVDQNQTRWFMYFEGICVAFGGLLYSFKEQLAVITAVVVAMILLNKVGTWVVVRHCPSPTRRLTKNEWRYLWICSRGSETVFLGALGCIVLLIFSLSAFTGAHGPPLVIAGLVGVVFSLIWLWEMLAMVIVGHEWRVW